MEELTEYLKKAGYDATPEEIVAIIRRLDMDGSQSISLDEWNNYMAWKDPAPREVDVKNYNPQTFALYEPYRPYLPYYSRYWDYPYYPYHSRYSPYPYWRSPYYYDRYLPYSSYVPPYRSPVRKEVVYTSYSPVSTAYTYSSPVRTIYGSPYLDRTYVSPYTGSVIYY